MRLIACMFLCLQALFAERRERDGYLLKWVSTPGSPLGVNWCHCHVTYHWHQALSRTQWSESNQVILLAPSFTIKSIVNQFNIELELNTETADCLVDFSNTHTAVISLTIMNYRQPVDCLYVLSWMLAGSTPTTGPRSPTRRRSFYYAIVWASVK